MEGKKWILTGKLIDGESCKVFDTQQEAKIALIKWVGGDATQPDEYPNYASNEYGSLRIVHDNYFICSECKHPTMKLESSGKCLECTIWGED